MQLRSERLWLAPIDATQGHGDADLLHRVLSDPFVFRYLLDGQRADRAAAKAWTAKSAATFAAWGYGLWHVRWLAHDEVLGFCGLVSRDDLPPSLLYALLPAATGHGVAREAARAVIAHARDVLGLPELHADVDAVNVDSVRVLEDLGFVRTGTRTGAFGPLLDYALALT